jgi:hypothetical protein
MCLVDIRMLELIWEGPADRMFTARFSATIADWYWRGVSGEWLQA